MPCIFGTREKDHEGHEGGRGKAEGGKWEGEAGVCVGFHGVAVFDLRGFVFFVTFASSWFMLRGVSGGWGGTGTELSCRLILSLSMWKPWTLRVS